VGFIGPNGAGKTTTLKILSGIMYPTSGKVRVDGFIPWERKKEYQRQISIVMGQKAQLWWDLPPMDSFILIKEIYQIPKKQFEEKVGALIDLLDIKEQLATQVRKLSLGQRMKCEIIAALLYGPRILYLDEPTIGVDLVTQEKIRNFLKDHNDREKTTIILTSHYMQDIERVCDRVIFIDRGKIIFDGQISTLYDKYAKEKNLELLFKKQVAAKDLEVYGQLTKLEGKKAIIKVERNKSPEIAGKILSKLPVEDILITEPDLEEIIQRFYGTSS